MERPEKAAVSQSCTARPTDFNSVLSVFQGFDNYALFGPFLILALNKHMCSNWKLR